MCIGTDASKLVVLVVLLSALNFQVIPGIPVEIALGVSLERQGVDAVVWKPFRKSRNARAGAELLCALSPR